jgi:hypothetical protein
MAREYLKPEVVPKIQTSGVVGLHQRCHGVRLGFDSRSETQCKLVHQGIPLVRLVTSAGYPRFESRYTSVISPESVPLYIYVPTNANYRDDCICRGWDSHRGVNLTALTAISAQA